MGSYAEDRTGDGGTREQGHRRLTVGGGRCAGRADFIARQAGDEVVADAEEGVRIWRGTDRKHGCARPLRAALGYLTCRLDARTRVDQR